MRNAILQVLTVLKSFLAGMDGVKLQYYMGCRDLGRVIPFSKFARK